MVIDYGAAARELYGPQHRAGTLMTYRGHVADASAGAPYRDVGERDLTAHVDTTTLARLLSRAGFAVLGDTTQAELLAGCGLEDLLERERGRVPDLAAALLLRSAVMRLLDPRHLGGFRAVVAGRGIASSPPLRGVARRAAPGGQPRTGAKHGRRPRVVRCPGSSAGPATGGGRPGRHDLRGRLTPLVRRARAAGPVRPGFVAASPERSC